MDRRRWIPCCLLALAFAACGGGGHDGPGDALPDTRVDEAALPDTLPDDDVTSDRAPPPSAYEIILLTDVDGCLPSLIDESHPVRVKVVDYAAQSAAADVEVVYTITAVETLDGTPVDEGDGSLASEQATTDADGVARNDFRCGPTGDRRYTITVSTPAIDAAPKTVCVTCSDVPRGCLEVKVQWLGAGVVSDVVVQALPGDYGCDVNLGPRMELEPSIPIAELEVPNLASSIRLEDLPEGPVTLRVRARWADPNGGYVPPGGPTKACFSLGECRDAVNVLPNQCKTVTVDLGLWPLLPTGPYDSVDKFDFSALIAECAGGDTSILTCASGVGNVGQTICCALAELKKLFDTPGDFLFDNITDLAKQALPTILVDAFVSLFHDAVVKILDNLVDANAPPWVKQFLEVGGDFVTAITTVELLSDLTLSKVQTNYMVDGSHFWTGIALTFLGNRTVYSLSQLQGAKVPVTLVGATYHAQVESHDRLVIQSHEVKLNYGRLVLFVLDEVVIPSLTNGQAHSIPDAIKLWIDCKSVAQGILGEISSWFGNNDPKVIEDACNGAIGLAAPLLPQFLDALALDTHLSLAGRALMVDEDCDAKSEVEHLTKGTWEGTVESSGSVQGTITGTFEAVRKTHAAQP